MKNIYKNKKYPVEHLIFNVANTSRLNDFIDLDEKIWTYELSKFKGFISKEVWINDNNPGEVHTILIWETMDEWKSIPLEKLKEIDDKFIEAYNGEFKIVRRIHKENNHGIYKVRFTVGNDR